MKNILVASNSWYYEKKSCHDHLCAGFLCAHEFSTHLSKFRRTVIAGLYGKIMWNCQTVFQKSHTMLLSHQQWMKVSLCCSTSSPAFDVVSVLVFRYSNRYERYLIGLIYNSLVTCNAEIFSYTFFAIFISSLVKCLWDFCPFFIWVACFHIKF